MYGVIGHGTLGKAVTNGLKLNAYKWWSKDPAVPTTRLPNVVEAKAVFVCVPTPVGPDGYDLNAIEDALSYLINEDYDGIVIMMSTIGVFDHRDLAAWSKDQGAKFHLFVSPEFLTERNAKDELYYSKVVHYGPWVNAALDRKVQAALRAPRLMNVKCVRMSAMECALLKTCRNAVLTQKLLAANLAYLEARGVGISPKKAQELVNEIFKDPRLHTEVRYHKVGNHLGTYGVEGKCLPKDLQAMAFSSRGFQSYYEELVRVNQRLSKTKVK